MAAAAHAAQAALSAELAALQARWMAREPRPEDVAALAELRGLLLARDEAVRVAEEQLNQLKAQMLLREDTYNKHFKYVHSMVHTSQMYTTLVARKALSTKCMMLLSIMQSSSRSLVS